MTARTAVLFLTHVWTPAVRARFERLRREIGDAGEVFLLAQKSPAMRSVAHDFARDPSALVVFDAAVLSAHLHIPYLCGMSLVPGSTHFPLLAFFRNGAEFDFYVVVEHDVEFSGNWRDLIGKVAGATPDFASSHIAARDDDPDWPWWTVVHPADADRDWAQDRRSLRKSFNPIYALSRRGLEVLDAAHRDGWHGHYEVLLATLLTRRGCKVVDLVELGLYIVGSQDARGGEPAEQLSTVRWRPEISPEEFERRTNGHTLFHPVKGPWAYDGSRIVSFA